MTNPSIDTVGISPIETVTVEASHLMDWPRFILTAAIFLAVVRMLK